MLFMMHYRAGQCVWSMLWRVPVSCERIFPSRSPIIAETTWLWRCSDLHSAHSAVLAFYLLNYFCLFVALFLLFLQSVWIYSWIDQSKTLLCAITFCKAVWRLTDCIKSLIDWFAAKKQIIVDWYSGKFFCNAKINHSDHFYWNTALSKWLFHKRG